MMGHLPSYFDQWVQVAPSFSSETNKMDNQMVEKLKSAIKAVLICHPAAVATAGGRPPLSVLAVALMIGREFQTFSELNLLRFLSRCCHRWRVDGVIRNLKVS